MITVEELYRHFGVLADSKDKISEHVEDYQAILLGVKSGSNAKRLSSQFIARFCKHFPQLMVDSINAMFDLCEDTDILIRKQAIKDLPQICKIQTEQVTKITEALTTLLACDDPTELTLLSSSLVSLFKINPKDALIGFLASLGGDDVDAIITENALKFLASKLKVFKDDWLTQANEELIVQEFKKLLPEAGKDEFILMLDILKQLTVMSSVTGRQQLVDIISSQAELDQPFSGSDPDDMERLIQCGKQVLPLFSKNVHSRPFIDYICSKVLPVVEEVSSMGESGVKELELFKLLADFTDHCGEISEPESKLQAVYDQLLKYMPEPPIDVDTVDDLKADPTLQFSHVECLLFSFHRLAKKYPQFLTDADHEDRLKNFKLRLQFFTRGVQTYIKQLRAALQNKTPTELKEEENKLKVIALKTTTNINHLAKDLLHVPPSYKATVTPSWIEANSEKIPTGEKRSPVTMRDKSDSAKKFAREPQTFYTPPRDKYSSNYMSGIRGRGRSSGRRGRGYRKF